MTTPSPQPPDGGVSDDTLAGLHEMAGTCAVKGKLLRQLIEEIQRRRASASADIGEAAEVDRRVALRDCRWTQMDDGGHAYNTCEHEYPYHIEPDCDPWPHCHHCGGRVVLIPWAEWGDELDDATEADGKAEAERRERKR